MKQKDSMAKNQMIEQKDLSKHLISTNEIACKIQLRAVVSSYNGYAGLYFLKKNYDEAIKIYKHVLQLAKQYSEKISVDSLLQIHAIHNMIEAFAESGNQENLSEYKVQMDVIVLKYLKEKSELVVVTKKAFEETRNDIRKLYKELGVNQLAKVIADAVYWVKDDNTTYINKLNEELGNPILQNQRNKKYDL